LEFLGIALYTNFYAWNSKEFLGMLLEFLGITKVIV